MAETETGTVSTPEPLVVRLYLVAGALVSAFTWLVAPALQDQREPWDSPFFLYRGAFLIGGGLLGLIRPKPFSRGLPSAWFGAWVGQLPFIAFSSFRHLGVWSTAFGALFFAGGVFIGTMFRVTWKRG